MYPSVRGASSQVKAPLRVPKSAWHRIDKDKQVGTYDIPTRGHGTSLCAAAFVSCWNVLNVRDAKLFWLGTGKNIAVFSQRICVQWFSGFVIHMVQQCLLDRWLKSKNNGKYPTVWKSFCLCSTGLSPAYKLAGIYHFWNPDFSGWLFATRWVMVRAINNCIDRNKPEIKILM